MDCYYSNHRNGNCSCICFWTLKSNSYNSCVAIDYIMLLMNCGLQQRFENLSATSSCRYLNSLGSVI